MGQLWDIGGVALSGRASSEDAWGCASDISAADFLSGLNEICNNVAKLARFADDSFPCLVLGNKKDLVLESNDAEAAGFGKKRRETHPSFSALSHQYHLRIMMYRCIFGDLEGLCENKPQHVGGQCWTKRQQHLLLRLPVGRADTSASGGDADAAAEIFNGDEDGREGDEYYRSEGGAGEEHPLWAKPASCGVLPIKTPSARLRKYDPVGADFRLVQVLTDKILRGRFGTLRATAR